MDLKKDNIEKINDYINGVASEDEIKEVESLFIDGSGKLYFRNSLEKDWENILKKETTGKDLGHLLDKIHHTIRMNEGRNKQRLSSSLIRIYMKAAAIIILPVLLTVGLLYNHLWNNYKTIEKEGSAVSTIFAPKGARVSFSLPDGTRGMLNSGSTLTYAIPFALNRKISLEGEAWFEVKHDERNPFEISAGNSVIKVLGTSFNLSAYPSENYVEVVLKEGEIEFTTGFDKEKVKILPSERLILSDKHITKSVVDPSKYNAWTEGKLVFRGDPMAEVARRIERWYNVKINLASPELEKYSFRATFQDDDLDDVLRFLTMTSPITYKISESKIMADGTIKKEEVTFYLKK